MASGDEAGPREKHIKLYTTEPIMDVRSMNKLFPKIDNLEHFPLKVLLNIFTRLDDIDLYNLAEESVRFEKIAKIVLNERYTHQNFIVDESKKEWERKDYDLFEPGPFGKFVLFLKRFGEEIKAIEIKNVIYMDKMNHAITRLLDKTKNLKKITLDQCRIENENLLQHAGINITHLTLRSSYSTGEFSLPEYRNLKKLEIWAQSSGNILMGSMVEIFRNNPTLESLILSECGRYSSAIARTYPFDAIMLSIGTHLNQLKELSYVCNKEREWGEPSVPNRQPDHIVDGFVRSLQHLKSLTLSLTIDKHTDFFGLLRRLNSECTNIKHLKSYDVDGENIELFDVIKQFSRIESLALRFNNFSDESNKIELFLSMMMHLPCLRHLTLGFDIYFSIDWFYITLKLLERSPSLEKLTLESNYEDGEIEIIGTFQFYTEFVESIQNQNVKLEVKFQNQLIGSISKNEVIWRNKLMHWAGYDPDRNSSNTNLLDLAEEPQDAANDGRPNPFDLILGYLDLKSLYSLSNVSKKCSQLVKNHIKLHSQQQEIFTITNEFNKDADYDGLEKFAEYVINLRVNIFHQNINALRGLLQKFQNLKKLYIFTDAFVHPHDLIVPQVRYLNYDGSSFNGYSQLHELSVMCPDLETIELKQAVGGRFDEREKERLKFRNLKRFTLKYERHIDQQMENLQTIFKDTKTKVFLQIVN